MVSLYPGQKYGCFRTGSGKGVLTHTFLKKVCFALKGNQFHPKERVLHMIELGLWEASQYWTCM